MKYALLPRVAKVRFVLLMLKSCKITYIFLLKMPLIHFNGHNFTIPHIHELQNLKKYFGGDIQKFTSKLPGFHLGKI